MLLRLKIKHVLVMFVNGVYIPTDGDAFIPSQRARRFTVKAFIKMGLAIPGEHLS